MESPYANPPSSRRLIGFAVVVVLHLVIGYALVTGLARNVVDIIKKPLDTKIIVELPPLPPPPPPPPPREIVKPQAAPKADLPPPAYVPPPEVAPPPTAPVLQAVESTPPAAPVDVKPPPEMPVAAAPKPEQLTVEGSCPGYAETLRKAFAGLYDKHEIAGTVTVRVQVRGSTITKVSVVSGPREYHRAVIAAVGMLNCQVSGGAEGWFDLPIVFREQ